MSLALVPQHGYVLGTLVGGVLVQNVWMAIQVGMARRKYKVCYPTMYAKEDTPDAKTFNCVQRAHQNTLEMISTFNTLLIVAGARYPIAASVAGLVYIVGRIVFFKGYSTGKADNRRRGAFNAFGLLALIGMVGRWGIELATSR
ncbi:Microsomal glutathione S-transferase 3 [Auxenochlorella protothecoides]|uniref:Glutathione S-transferase 3, mitochondrial n=2 Tax=Auxenochlorella protothecoides TaxID=3075 RepID=A0A087SKB1_AUXPR|nr:Microsomal glutathione S-transferase 3 [Auxenochlorella protothecoides]KFM26165.1 Microsomal glutathione S-transferase 3 [Auxenochlorella protothecoides]RMZ56856.1 hypothetical protein APUTEX25_002945 [Auxenochlorella protothecoides]|eukprot:RMZ56856.1 hypothetical protein APUTEX25_002945 [Auxenochlorella protothecoides]